MLRFRPLPFTFMLLLPILLVIACISVDAQIEVPTPTPGPTLIPISEEALSNHFLTPTPYDLPPTLTPAPTPTLSTENTFMDPDILVEMVKQARPAIVRVTHTGGSGSGVIFETDGRDAYILTNEHVIRGAQYITVYVNESQGHTATTLGKDAQRDLAVLKICCGNFTSLPFGDKSDLQPGLLVVNIGYALALEGAATVTTGIISAVRYERSKQAWVVQSDAALNPGNSGGPMLSTDGTILGINTYKIDQSNSGRDAEGLGFAVSIETVLEQLGQLRNTGNPPQVGPTVMPRPTSTPTIRPRPTPTPYVNPQAPTRVPTATPRPTPTPYSTPTPRPTPTPYLTPTPYPTSTPAPSQSRAESFGPVNGRLRVTEDKLAPSHLYNFATNGDTTVDVTFHVPPNVYDRLEYGLVFRHSGLESSFVFEVSDEYVPAGLMWKFATVATRIMME